MERLPDPDADEIGGSKGWGGDLYLRDGLVHRGWACQGDQGSARGLQSAGPPLFLYRSRIQNRRRLPGCQPDRLADHGERKPPAVRGLAVFCGRQVRLPGQVSARRFPPCLRLGLYDGLQARQVVEGGQAGCSSLLIVPVALPCTRCDRRSPVCDGRPRRDPVLGQPTPGSAGGVLRKPGTIPWLGFSTFSAISAVF